MGKYSFKFIDLFAGIGGFHQAMRFLGGECVMAAEIDPFCVETYKENYEVKDIRGDVSKIDPKTIPQFDVLCAGFPCQPFSKAGAQKGFADPGRGNLFHSIMKILDDHIETKFVILENVRNLADKTENWEIIKTELMKRNFYITEDPFVLSPTHFGIPQLRERVYILAVNKDFRNEEILTNGFIHKDDLLFKQRLKQRDEIKVGTAFDILEKNVSGSYRISTEEEFVISAWKDFIYTIDKSTLARPIWISCFGNGIADDEEFFKKIQYEKMPDWKKNFVKRNRNMYLKNKVFIDNWIIENGMTDKNKIFQKFEWNCGNDDVKIEDTIIQIRQSGIRVKRANYFPSLVAMVNTPIVWDKEKKYYRRITVREAANLQNFNKRFKFIGSEKQTYKQLGNSVNVRVLKIIGDSLFRLGKWKENHESKDKY